MIERIVCLVKGHAWLHYEMGLSHCQRCGLHDFNEPNKGNDMTNDNQVTYMTLPMKNKLVRIILGGDLERLVNKTFRDKPWKFCGQTSPHYVPSVTRTPEKISETAVETWKSGINGRHYQVSPTVLIRHMCAKGLIPEGNYLILPNPQFSCEPRLSDEAVMNGPKGVC